MTQKKFQIRFSIEATYELETTAHWYEEHRKGLGSEFLNSIEAVTASIQRTPMLFRVVYKDTRKALVKRFPFAVFFRYKENVIDILAVYHTKRDFASIKKRL